MTETPFPRHEYPEDVSIIQLADKTALLIGTAHISRESTDLVERVIEQERPDTVCITVWFVIPVKLPEPYSSATSFGELVHQHE